MTELRLDELATLWPILNRTERAEAVYILQEAGITQGKIALFAGVSPRNIRSRKADANVFVKLGTIPSGKFCIDIDRKDVIDEEMDRRDRLATNKQARSQITDTVICQGILDQVLNLVQNQGLLDSTSYSLSKAFTFKTDASVETAIMHWSDLHFGRHGEGVSEDSIRNAIIKYLFDAMKIISERRRSVTINDLHVFINGDMLHGTQNFLAQTRETTGSMCYQVVATAQLLINCLAALKPFFSTMTVTITGGNHGRVFQKDDLTAENSEFLVGAIIQAYFAQASDVTVDVAWGSFYRIVNVQGHRFMVTHGDTIQGSGTQESIVGTAKRWDSTATIPPFDSICMGHWHKSSIFSLPARYGESYKSRKIFVGGTASRDDNFLSTTGSTPSLQWWLIFTDGTRLTSFNEINLYSE